MSRAQRIIGVAIAAISIEAVASGVADADPGSCGAQEDPLTCSPQQGPPSPAEAAYLGAIRGQIPGDDALLLATGRGVCNMLRGGVSVTYVASEVSTHLGITTQQAGQVMVAVTENACPSAHLNQG